MGTPNILAVLVLPDNNNMETSGAMKAHNLPTAGRWALIKERSIPTDINKGNGDGR